MTTPEVDKRNTRSLRVFDSSWKDLESAAAEDHSPPSTLAGDAIEALVGYTRCNRCKEPVPYEWGDLTGTDLLHVLPLAVREAVRQRCSAHRPVLVSRALLSDTHPVAAKSTAPDPVRQLREDIPGLTTASELPPARPGSIRFQPSDPDLARTVPAPVAAPEPADHTRKQRRACKHPKVRGKGVCPDCHEWVGSKP